MNIEPGFKWSGGVDSTDGRALFTLPTGREVELWFPTFTAAHTFYDDLQFAFEHVRWDARSKLLNEISRIAP